MFGRTRRAAAGIAPARRQVVILAVRVGQYLIAHQRHADEIIALFVLDQRSEEHTSELQSLMRTSYAVFCLKHTKTISSLSRDHQQHNHTIFAHLIQSTNNTN